MCVCIYIFSKMAIKDIMWQIDGLSDVLYYSVFAMNLNSS